MTAIWAENLLNLQNLDMEIRNLKIRLNMLPKEAEVIQQKIAAAESAVKKLRSRKAAHELEYKQNEDSIAELNEKITKLQEQSDLVKKNTEYQAMLGSIAMLKKSISDIETRQLELMELIEQDASDIRTAVANAKPQVAGYKAEMAELAELNNDIKRRGRELLAQRPELRKLVDAEVLPRYEQILQQLRKAD